VHNLGVMEYLEGRSLDGMIVWAETADEILEAVARFCKRTSDSGH